MSFLAGIIIITFSFYIPAPMPAGIFWPALIVAIPSLIIGSYSYFKILWFSLGVLSGSAIIIVINFSQWESMAFILAALQIIPTFAAIVSFLFGWAVFGVIKSNNNTLKQ